ncbi:hypothetical protein [Notoacmeibacter marinus]|uniref:hypothetical protein n=1 Tax=Notoacmeibacter marinus TaxID=1876515 RepID=UPI000DF3F407|nr:hypothetical protein [Notoacmeibacter marinus]
MIRPVLPIILACSLASYSFAQDAAGKIEVSALQISGDREKDLELCVKIVRKAQLLSLTEDVEKSFLDQCMAFYPEDLVQPEYWITSKKMDEIEEWTQVLEAEVPMQDKSGEFSG